MTGELVMEGGGGSALSEERGREERRMPRQKRRMEMMSQFSTNVNNAPSRDYPRSAQGKR